MPSSCAKVGVDKVMSGVPVPAQSMAIGTLLKRSVITTDATSGARFRRRHSFIMNPTPGESVRVPGKFARW